MNIGKTLKHYKEQIDNELRLFLKNKIEKVNNVSPSSKEIMEHIMEFNLRGGKRIRPTLLIFGYKAFGGKKENEILKAALAVELMESFFLIHDDIIDQDELRRGYLTMHKIYENKCKRCYKNIDAKRYGESMAIIAGDILSILGSEAILYTNFPIKNKLKAIDKFNRCVINTNFGQILDIKSSLDPEIKETDINRIHQLKTAIYTIETPLHIGAILTGAKKKELKTLSNYAIPLGQAFQIKDDILGLFSTKQKIGKPVGNDIREGKKTLLILKALEKAGKKEKSFILNCLGNKKATEKNIEKIKQIVIKTGSLDYSEDLAKNLVEKAKKAIINSKLKKQGKEFLLGIADYIINRRY